jgi:hypothetical protein
VLQARLAPAGVGDAEVGAQIVIAGQQGDVGAQLEQVAQAQQQPQVFRPLVEAISADDEAGVLTAFGQTVVAIPRARAFDPPTRPGTARGVGVRVQVAEEQNQPGRPHPACRQRSV